MPLVNAVMIAPQIITLLTDFGTRDPYVGVMKGVIFTLCPEVQIVDLTHEIPPQDVRTAAWHISTSYGYFPAGTIHLAVVDPGVGTSRRPILVICHGHFFVGPDNGLFSAVYQSERPFQVYALNQERYFLKKISATFQARDIFAPVAGHLACGTPPEEMGKRITDPVVLVDMKPRTAGGALYGQVVWIDRFGNLITNISEEQLKILVRWNPFVIRLGSASVRSLHETYAAAANQAIIAIMGSSGYLEIAQVSGSAARKLKMGLGDPVTVTIEKRPGGKKNTS